jgi:ubiquinone/menaquinone biosynthesis C-methylase UbiE
MADAAIEAWTTYWRTGQAASCFSGDAAEVQFAEIWRDFVAGFSSGARLVDLAAGNGAAVLLCASHARELGLDLHFHAVDAAEIDPAGASARAPMLSSVAFQGSVRLERLPFPDASFDGALSQFGFEYADEAKAVREVARVLAPGGRLRLVMHAENGAVEQDIRRRLERLDRAMQEGGAMGLVRALARAADMQDGDTLQRRSPQLPKAAAMLQQMAAGAPADDAAVFYSKAFLSDWAQRERYRPADLRRAVEDGWKNAAGVALRQRQMLKAARSREDLVRLCERFRHSGLQAAPPVGVTDQRQIQIAWLVDAMKPQA